MLLCSGKIYYDLAEKRRGRQRDDIAIVRVEQLYPLPAAEIAAELAPTRTPGADLGPGGAGQPGRLAVHGDEPAGALGRGLA